jgi:hypothetical protein
MIKKEKIDVVFISAFFPERQRIHAQNKGGARRATISGFASAPGLHNGGSGARETTMRHYGGPKVTGGSYRVALAAATARTITRVRARAGIFQ